MTRLPSSLDDLGGRRAARWIRESTDRQAERYGPDAQREQQDRALERFGLVDTGLAWQVAHSGRTVARTAAFAEMRAAAGDTFDVLLVGYVSRFARDLRTAVNARHDLHAAGAALLFCDERVLSSDEDAWESWAREALEAEAYSRRLGRRVTEGYEAKFRRHRDPGGNAPLGFRRVEGRLEVDPVTIGRAVEAFRRYAAGTVSMATLEAETGIDHEAMKGMLRNPIYNGWVRRHRRRPDETLLEAPWRADRPVDDALWARVQEVRHDRDTGGGRAPRRHVHPLAGLLFCPCGARLRGEASPKRRAEWTQRRYRHPDACPHWATSTRTARLLEEPIDAQVTQMRLGAPLLANLRRLAGVSVPAVATSLRRRQLERELELAARRHARRAIATDAYLAEHGRLVEAIEADREHGRDAAVVDPDAAIGWLRDMRRLWRAMDDAGRRDLAHALYQRISATSDGVVGVALTPEAERHGAALAMPEWVVLARPEGSKGARTTHRVGVPIEGRREWLRLVRSA